MVSLPHLGHFSSMVARPSFSCSFGAVTCTTDFFCFNTDGNAPGADLVVTFKFLYIDAGYDSLQFEHTIAFDDAASSRSPHLSQKMRDPITLIRSTDVRREKS